MNLLGIFVMIRSSVFPCLWVELLTICCRLLSLKQEHRVWEDKEDALYVSQFISGALKSPTICTSLSAWDDCELIWRKTWLLKMLELFGGT